MKSRAASLAYYYANKEAILKAAAEKLKAKRVAEFGSEEAWRARLEKMNREKALAASKENSYPRLCYRLLAAAASHPDVLAFSLRGLHALQEQKRKKGREYMRSYGAKPEAKQAKQQRDRRLAIRRGRPNPAAWPAAVWLRFLDALIAHGTRELQAEEAAACRRIVREGLKQLEGSLGVQETDRLIRRFDRRKWKRRPDVRVLENLRERLRLLVRKCNTEKAAPTAVLVGCSPSELREHLEKQFTPEMNWDNYGSYWHVDHIRPCASFDLSSKEEQRRCFHFLNLQPLDGVENMRKGAKYG